MATASAARPAIRTRAILFIACLGLAAAVVRTGAEINGDGRLAYAYALVDHGTAAVDAYAAAEPRLIEDLALIGGHYYLAKPPLPSLVIVPFYAALRAVLPPADIASAGWRWALTLLVSGVAFAVTAVLARDLGSRLGLRSPALGSAGIALGTPLVVYATYLFGHVLAGLLLIGLLLCAISAPRRSLRAGLLFGLLVSTELLPAVGALVLVGSHAAMALRERQPGAVVRLVVGAAVGSAPLALYLALVYGSPVANMYAFLADPVYRAAYADGGLIAPRLEVIAALLGSIRLGLFVFAPLALVGIVAGSAVLLRRGTAAVAVALSLATSAITVVALASTPLPYDGSQYGERYLLPLVPLLAWPIAALPRRWLLPLVAIAAMPQLLVLAIGEPLLPADYAVPYVQLAARYAVGALAVTLPAIALAAALPVDVALRSGAAACAAFGLAVPLLVARDDR